jgi:ABC-2 type transport system permease protein
MTTTDVVRPTRPARGGFVQAVSDARTITWRNLRGGWRVPDNQIYMFIQPIMFVLLFAYVFGGAIVVPGLESDPLAYRKILMGGIFVQTMAFAVAPASVGLADDMSKGLIDRFRSLPMARSAVISGRVVADLSNQAIVLGIMMACGLLVGWRVETGFSGFLAGSGLLLLFAFAMLWIGAFIGLSVGSPQVAASAGLIWLFPVTFLSNAFIPTSTLPDWLQPVAEWNPISAFVAAARELFGNPNPVASDVFPMAHPVLASLIWVVIIVGIFAPLAVRKYKSATSK